MNRGCLAWDAETYSLPVRMNPFGNSIDKLLCPFDPLFNLTRFECNEIIVVALHPLVEKRAIEDAHLFGNISGAHEILASQVRGS